MHLVLEALGSDSDADNIAGFGILHDILEKQRKRRIILLCLIALLNAEVFSSTGRGHSRGYSSGDTSPLLGRLGRTPSAYQGACGRMLLLLLRRGRGRHGISS